MKTNLPTLPADGITSVEARNLLRLSKQRVQQLCEDGLLDAVQIAGRWIISRKSVLERLRNCDPRGGRPRQNSPNS